MPCSCFQKIIFYKKFPPRYTYLAILKNEKQIGNIVFVIGPETAASIAEAIEAVKNEVPILASLSLGNLDNLKNLIADHWKPKKVIIAADNDGDESQPSAISDLEKFLQSRGINVDICVPELENSQTKSDWNDILISHGTNHIRNIFLKN